MYAAKKRTTAREPYTIFSQREYDYFARIRGEELFFAYLGLKRHCWKGETRCWPSEERLAEVMNCKIITVRRRLQELERLGVIGIIHAPQSGRRGNVYELQPLASWARVPEGALVEFEPIVAAPQPGTGDPEPDHGRSPTQQKDQAEKKTQQPTAPAAEAAEEVVSIDILHRIRDRLKALGSEPTSRFLATLTVYGNEALEHALDCMAEYKGKIHSPPAFLRRALQEGWAPSQEYLEQKQQAEVARLARERQGPIDDLARIWGKHASMALEDLQCHIQADINRSQQPLAERVRAWSETCSPWSKADAAREREMRHDEYVATALRNTAEAGLMHLLPATEEQIAA